MRVRACAQTLIFYGFGIDLQGEVDKNMHYFKKLYDIMKPT